MTRAEPIPLGGEWRGFEALLEDAARTPPPAQDEEPAPEPRTYDQLH